MSAIEETRPLRLASVIQGPAFGGAHNQALALAPLLEQRGISTTVVLPLEAGAAAERLRRSGLEVVRMPLSRLRASPDPRLQARFVSSLGPDVRRLRHLLRSQAADIVQVHGITNAHGAVAGRLEGVGVVWQLFDTRAPMLLRRLGAPLLTRLADQVTTWGDELARVHPGVAGMGECVQTVYPPVERERFEPDADLRAKAREWLGISAGELVVGSVGVLNPQKGHEYLIAAAETIVSCHPHARFVICGGSSPAHASYERDLRSQIRRPALRGRVQIVDPGGDVPLLMQAFDVFALTSVPRSEGMPTAILEAMHARKPVVSARVGAVDELVVDGATALVVAPEDQAAIADALNRLLEDGGLRRRLGLAGEARATTRFDLERLADIHARVYRRASRADPDRR